MFQLFNNRGKRLYKKYVNSSNEGREATLAEVVEKYKTIPEEKKAGFRKIISKKLLKVKAVKNGRNDEANNILRLAKEIGMATGWKEGETDSNAAESIKRFLEKQEDIELTISALDALYAINYGEAEFWETMLYKEPAIVLFVVKKIGEVEGAEEIFRKNLKAFIPLLDSNKIYREIIARHLSEADEDIKKTLLEKMIKDGVHEEFIEALPAFFESEQTRYLLLGWLAGNKIGVKASEKGVPKTEKIFILAKKIKETEKELIKKAMSILPKLPPQERLLVHHFLCARRIKTKEEDDEFLASVIVNQKVHPVLRRTALKVYMDNGHNNNEEFSKDIEKRINETLESARPTALIEAYDMGMLLAVINQEKGERSLEKVYEEAVDVLEDEDASENQKEVAAAVSFLYITNFKKGVEEFKKVYEDALAILKRNGRIQII